MININKILNYLTVNGKKSEVSGKNIKVVVMVDGKEIESLPFDGKDLRIIFEGDLANLDCNNANVYGSVHGKVDANSVSIAGNVGMNVDANSVEVKGDVKGNVDGTSVICRDIHGKVDAMSISKK